MNIVSGDAVRVHDLETQLREMQARLLEVRSETEQFAAQICHDVEAPLRGVSAFAQLIEEQRAEQLAGDERAILEHVHASGDRLRHLLQSFLSYCQLGRSHANSGPVDLRIAALSASQTLRPRVQATGAAIQIPGLFPVVHGDFAELQQVFEQLISNALDYRQPGSVPAVTVAAERAGPEEWTVSVEDNGPGVPAQHQALIFLPFKRLHGREIPGSGMGLAIAKRIVEAHGGRIWVESGKKGGARFCFALPPAKSAGREAW